MTTPSKIIRSMIKTAISNSDTERYQKAYLAQLGLGTGTTLGAYGLVAVLNALENKLQVGRPELIEKIKETMTPPGFTIKENLPSFLSKSFPSRKLVMVSKKTAPSILAHELNHAKGFLGGDILQNIGWHGGLQGAPLALVAQMFTEPGSTATNIFRYAPAVLSAPVIAEEIRASAKALAKLKELGGKGAMLKGIPTLAVGLGSYIAGATLPIWGGKIVQNIIND